MSVSSSATDIVNLALDIIKTDNISAVELPGTDEIAIVANRWYDDVRQMALEDHPFDFATKRITIPLSATAPLTQYSDAYVLPSDYLSLIAIVDDLKPLSYWDYEISQNRLEIDNSGESSLLIRYTWDNIAVSTYTATFKIYLAHLLASAIVSKLTGNAGVIRRVQAMVAPVRAMAKAKNGKDSPVKIFKESKMLNGRKLYEG